MAERKKNRLAPDIHPDFQHGSLGNAEKKEGTGTPIQTKNFRKQQMMVIGNRSQVYKAMMFAWLLSFLSIPLFSFYGRPLQLYTMTRFSTEELTFQLGLFFGAMVIILFVSLLKTRRNPYAYHLVWVMPLAIFFYFSLPFVEKIHIALFGLFGFLTQKLFEQKMAAVFCISISFLDELFQHFLVDRVGDWRDVWLNLFSASLGMFIAFILSEAGSKNSTENSTEC